MFHLKIFREGGGQNEKSTHREKREQPKRYERGRTARKKRGERRDQRHVS